MSTQENRVSAREHFTVLFTFILLTIIFTYPLIFEWTEQIRVGEGDAYWFLWNLWRFEQSFEKGEDLFFSTQTFYPTGTSLFLSTTTPLLSFVSVPLQNVVGLLAAYNLLYLLSYPLSAYLMYLLAYHLTKNSWAAFLAGIVFAFSPYHSAHAYLGHLNLMHMQFIPFFFLFYLKLKEAATFQRVVGGAIAVALLGYTEIMYLGLCLLYVLFDFLYDHLIYKKPTVRHTLTGIFSSLFLGFLLLSPYLFGFLYEIVTVEYTPYATLEFTSRYSVDLIAFFVPPSFHPILSSFFEWAYSALGKVNWLSAFIESSVYLGISVLALAIYARLKIKKYHIQKWFDFFLVAMVFAMGPFPIIFGYTIPFLLPYFFAYLVPFFSMFRVPARFDVFVMLTAAILVAYGYVQLQKRLSNRRRFLPYFLTLLILFEFWAPPPEPLDLSIHPLYYALAQDSENGAIFAVPQEDPLTFSHYNTLLLYVQTVHNKTIVGGGLSRSPNYVFDFTKQSCVKNLATLNFSTYCTQEEYNAQLGSDIRYVIYHKDAPPWLPHNSRIAMGNMERLFGSPVFEDEQLAVYCRFNCNN